MFFKGSAEKPGLTVLAIVEFICLVEKNGKSISVSFYEVDHQDHAVDLLNPGNSHGTNTSETLLVNQDNSLYITRNQVESNTKVVKDNLLPDVSKNVKCNPMAKNSDSSLDTSSEVEICPIEEKENNSLMINEQGEQGLAIVPEGQSINKENNSSMAYEDSSTPISSQLRDLSNRLKLLYSLTPLSV
ncbi:hypothetical protein PIB30_033850 [Stylosanthes scabra]|uniref:Uncharacterized protein n=1 Tax=Stylosanthes scabra TaxID=79078 RepID=A0ABU6RD88_9FABA|nr:hypothetical protein [Stylosanthes scabra]